MNQGYSEITINRLNNEIKKFSRLTEKKCLEFEELIPMDHSRLLMYAAAFKTKSSLEIVKSDPNAIESSMIKQSIIKEFTGNIIADFYSTEADEILPGEKYNCHRSVCTMCFSDMTTIMGFFSIFQKNKEDAEYAYGKFGYECAEFARNKNKTPFLLIAGGQVSHDDEIEAIAVSAAIGVTKDGQQKFFRISIPIFRSPCGVGVVISEFTKVIETIGGTIPLIKLIQDGVNSFEIQNPIKQKT